MVFFVAILPQKLLQSVQDAAVRSPNPPGWVLEDYRGLLCLLQYAECTPSLQHK